MENDINRDFGRLKAGYGPIVTKSKTHGTLLLDGITVEYNKPFALLNFLKVTKYLGIPNRGLKIISMTIK